MRKLLVWLMAAGVGLSGCAGEVAEDEAAVDTAAMPGMASDTGMGMDHGTMGGMHEMMMDSVMLMDSAGGMRGGRQMAMARDADQMFLRMMSDHHEGLIEMSMQAMERGSNAEVQGEAHELHTKQQAEQDSMVAQLQREYGEEHSPMVTRKNRAQLDSLSQASGAEYDRTYYRLVVDHHRDGIMMIDHVLERLQKPAVRQMAERMKADQQRDIERLQPKAGRG